MAAGRHRRPPAWRRAISGVLRVRTGVTAARTAALHAEVLALRATVDLLRADLDKAAAREAELVARLAAEPAETELAPPPVVPAPLGLELPLVRLALERDIEPPLTREMAVALASPDRGEDTANVQIVLAHLPEHSLLDPVAGRDADLKDESRDLTPAPETVRRSA